MQRQRDGMLEQFPIWDDVRTFDGRPWRGIVDVVSGGFPCQDISVAGPGDGLDGDRSGLWFEYERIVKEIRPTYVFAENSPALRTRGLGTIVKGLAELGYDTRWGVLGAWHLGSPHKRDRLWLLATDTNSERGRSEQITGAECKDPTVTRDDGTQEPMAYANRERELQPQGCEQEQWRRIGDRSEEVGNAHNAGREKQRGALAAQTKLETTQRGGWWRTEPAVGRVAHGVASRVDRLKAIGNGQVPAVAAAAFEILRGQA
jgi:DNA (cytosine-5)-methyltransferase 1